MDAVYLIKNRAQTKLRSSRTIAWPVTRLHRLIRWTTWIWGAADVHAAQS